MGRALCLLLFWIANLASAATPECDRACLKGALDQYLNAVVRHDPPSAPLLPGFRQTENAVVVRPGTGVWQSVTELGKIQRRYLDPETGQAGYFGLVEENNGLAIVTLRVKVVQRKVAEAEWLIARKGDVGGNGPVAAGQPTGNFFDPENLIANPPPERVLPPAERLPREALGRNCQQLLRRAFNPRWHAGDGARRLHAHRERLHGYRTAGARQPGREVGLHVQPGGLQHPIRGCPALPDCG